MSVVKPIVGVTGDFRPDRYNGPGLSWFNSGYYDSVISGGGLPMMLPPYDNDDDLSRFPSQRLHFLETRPFLARLRRPECFLSRATSPSHMVSAPTHNSNIYQMASKVLVVGSGVIGLRTALELLRKNVSVCLVSPKSPTDVATTSMGAGGLWMPFHCDDTRVNVWATETLDELATQHANVEVVPKVAFKRQYTEPPSWGKNAVLKFQEMDVDSLYKHGVHNNIRLPPRESIKNAGYTHAWLFYPPIVDAPHALHAMLQEIKMHKHTSYINVDTNKYFKTMKEIVAEARTLGCDGVVNCTGLGSKALCNDDSLVGARGVLLHYDRYHPSLWREASEDDTLLKDSAVTIQEEPFGSETMPCYIIPRGDRLVVGGTYLVGDEEECVRESERETIAKNAYVMGIDTAKNKPVGEWVGFRPYRSSVRLECDEDLSQSGVRVVHNYGFGGSGWTVYVGAAKEAAALMTRTT